MHLHSLAKKIMLVTFFCAAIIVGLFVSIVHSRLVDFSVLENYNPGQPSILLDDAGQEWGRFQLDRRKFVPLEQMPDVLQQAFLATEDHQFFQHHGISFKGIFRSLFVNLYYGKKMQGASTITQQLVRLLFFETKKTFKRKIKEQIFALLVEFQFTKEQILETYLNHVYFGHGIYGVQAACQRFWNIDVGQISLDQAAVLAGMVRSPSYYSPINSPDKVTRRRNTVLKLMLLRGCIDHDACTKAQAEQLRIAELESDCIAPHLKETIRILLEEQVGKQQLYSGGLTIQTTLNSIIQKVAQEQFVFHLASLKAGMGSDVDGGLISIAVGTGEIKAMVGGYDFKASKWNRALQAKRQMGSIFKPLVYATALENGASCIDTCIDEPMELKQGNQLWVPQNNTKKFVGVCTLARALSYSNNIVAIKTLLNVGIDKVIAMARRAHIRADMNPYPSLALGCVDVTLDQAVGAFNIFANNGVYVQPHYLRWVKDKLGVKIYKTYPIKEQAMSSAVASQILKVLTLGMLRLRSSSQWFGGDAAGKTGTTNDSRTCWFSGSTPEITTAIYIGKDNNQPLGHKVYGSKVAFPIWFGLSKEITHQAKRFYYDPSLQEISINWKTGQPCKDQNNSEVVKLLIS